MQTIQSIVRSEIQDFIHNSITVAQGYQFNQYENVKKIHLYENSRFYSGTSTGGKPLIEGYQEEEDKRLFFQVSSPRAKSVKRFFNIDVEDILLDEIDPQSEISLDLINKELKRYAEDNTKGEDGLGENLNAFIDPYVDYGTLVIEIQKDGRPEIIPLQDFFVDPTVKRCKDSRFNTIKYTLSAKQLRDKVADGWDKDAVEAIIEAQGETSEASASYENDGSNNGITSSVQVDVFKRYGWLPRYMIDGHTEDEEYDEEEIMTLTVVGVGNEVSKKTNKEDKDEVLYKVEWVDDLPIEDTHLYQTHGRWQGIGIYELLFPIQQRMNEVCNQKRISMEISALHLFQSADPSVLNNILSDLENGDIIRTKIPNAISPLVNEERNLSAFESEIVTYTTQGDKLSFANELLAGGDIPTSTPATNAVIQNNNQVLVHLQDRQNFTNFVANAYIKRHVVPKLIRELSDEHFLRVVSHPEDLLQIDDKIISLNFNRYVIDQAIKKGRVIDVLNKDDIKKNMLAELKGKGVNRYVKVIKDYYKNKIGDIIVIIGDEKKDMQKMANNTLQFFNILKDPTSTSDPVQRLFITDYGKQIGLSPTKIEIAFAKKEALELEMQQQQPQQPQGGTAKPMPKEQDPNLAQVL